MKLTGTIVSSNPVTHGTTRFHELVIRTPLPTPKRKGGKPQPKPSSAVDADARSLKGRACTVDVP